MSFCLVNYLPLVLNLPIWYEKKKMSQGTFHLALWRGIQVAVKRLEEELISDDEKVWVAHGLQKKIMLKILSHSLMDSLKRLVFCRKSFRDELALLQKIRHPNVVQFLGAVTQSSPMMIVTEYLPKVFFFFFPHPLIG